MMNSDDPYFCNDNFRNICQFQRDGRFCDVNLVSGNTQVKAHRVVLAASCAYFNAMFNVGLDESQQTHVSLPGVPSEVLPIIIDYIYTGNVRCSKSTVQHLMIAADMLQLEDLVEACGWFLGKELHPSNALGLLRFAEAHNSKELTEEALEYVNTNWNNVASEEELLELPLPQLVKLLSSEHLNVEHEAQVMYPALRWLEHDPVCRRELCSEVLSHIRLPHIELPILDDAIRNVRDPTISLALQTKREAMKAGSFGLAALSAPRPSACRVLLVVGGYTSDPVLKFDFHKREWTMGERWDLMARKRPQLAAATISGRVYAVGGSKDHPRLADGYAYDPQADNWSTIAPMKKARYCFGLTECKGHLYAFGGIDSRGKRTSSVETYDPVANTWTLAGYMPEAICGMCVVNYKGLIYLVGGCTLKAFKRALLRYDPESREWTTLAPMRHARWHFSAVVMHGYLYVIGGITLTKDGNALLNSVERFNFDDGSWEEVGSLQEARGRCMAGAAGGVLIVAGGVDSKRNHLSTVEVYDPSEDMWRPTTALPMPRADAGAAVV